MGVINTSNKKYINYKAKTGELFLNKEKIEAWQGELLDIKVEIEHYEGKPYNVYALYMRDSDNPMDENVYVIQLAEKSMTTKFIINSMVNQEFLNILKFRAWAYEGRTGLTVWNNEVKLDASQSKYPWNSSIGCWDGVPPVKITEFEGQEVKSDKAQLEFWRLRVAEIAAKLNPDLKSFIGTSEATPVAPEEPAPEQKPVASKATKKTSGTGGILKEHQELAAGYDDADVIVDSWGAILMSIADQPDIILKSITQVWQKRVNELGKMDVLNIDGSVSNDDLPF